MPLSKTVKIAAVLLVSSVILVWLCILLVVRFIYQDGINAFEMEEYDRARASLVKARSFLPETLASALSPMDLFRLDTAMGKTLYKLAVDNGRGDTLKERFAMLKTAQGHLDAALAIDSESYRTAYWAAKVEESLEVIFPLVDTGKAVNPYNALPLYERAMSLRPAGITVRYDMVNYLHHKGMADGIPDLVETMAEIYPPCYLSLKKEEFFSPELRDRVRAGLMRALEKEIRPRETLTALSQLSEDQGDLAGAVAFFTRAIALEPWSNTPATYIKLGMLTLRNSDPEGSYPWFIKALQAQKKTFDADLGRIWSGFKAEKRLAEFIEFSARVEEAFPPSPALDLCIAECWYAMDKLELAKARLLIMNTRQPSAKAFHYLALIAQKQGDLDAMELASQRATVLEPTSAAHLKLFAQALKLQKKEVQAGKVLEEIRHLAK
jgi:tetratricopeptide (TPR) repeat protein